MSDVNGLFSLTRTPQALPGKCGGCGRATDKLGFIDTGLQFDYYGALLFCSECVLDMASKFGLINMETADFLKNKVAELEVEVITQRKALLGVEEALDALQNIRDALTDLNIVDGSRNPVNPEPPAETPETGNSGEGLSEVVSGKPEEGNSEADGSVNEQGTDRVPSNSEYVDLDELEF